MRSEKTARTPWPPRRLQSIRDSSLLDPALIGPPGEEPAEGAEDDPEEHEQDDPAPGTVSGQPGRANGRRTSQSRCGHYALPGGSLRDGCWFKRRARPERTCRFRRVRNPSGRQRRPRSSSPRPAGSWGDAIHDPWWGRVGVGDGHPSRRSVRTSRLNAVLAWRMALVANSRRPWRPVTLSSGSVIRNGELQRALATDNSSGGETPPYHVNACRVLDEGTGKHGAASWYRGCDRIPGMGSVCLSACFPLFPG